jgi:uncharacterized membrane protein
MIDSLYLKWQYLSRYNNWIAWNLFLAFIPLVLSFYLFRRRFPSAQLQGASSAVPIGWPRSPLWWIALATYIAFLPNAPYVLTDIVHLIQATWATPSVVIVTFFYIPLHVSAILLAFEAYVVSLINQGAYLRRLGRGRYILWVEALTHILCAIGIYLGRFIRLNSWDIVVAPRSVVATTLNELTQRRPLVVMAVTALILALLYWVVKQLTLGILLRIREVRAGQHHFD